jgi:hypothetical protein
VTLDEVKSVLEIIFLAVMIIVMIAVAVYYIQGWRLK